MSGSIERADDTRPPVARLSIYHEGDQRPPASSLRGARIATKVSLPVCSLLLVGWLWTALREGSVANGFIVLVGLVLAIAVAMGALFGRSERLRRSGGTPLSVVMSMTVLSVVVGSYVAALVWRVDLVIANAGAPIFARFEPDEWLALGRVGLEVLGLPMLLLVLPHAWAWVALMREPLPDPAIPPFTGYR